MMVFESLYALTKINYIIDSDANLEAGLSVEVKFTILAVTLDVLIEI